MNQKRILIFSLAVAVTAMVACNSSDDKKTTGTDGNNATQNTSANDAGNPKGIGPHQNIQLTHPLDEAMVTTGKGIYDVKCSSCHKTTDEKLVGPGWKGVTARHSAEWIMNFVTNTDEMLNKDPKAQAQLEICLVRMPDQSLPDDDARHLLEFMRKNDGVK